MLRIAVLGCGRIGCMHAANIAADPRAEAARAKALKLGDGLDPLVQMGPVINGKRRGKLEGVVADAVEAGAKGAN